MDYYISSHDPQSFVAFLFRLEKERSHVQVKAHADAHAHVKDELNRILALEREAAHESIEKALLRERVTAEEERLRAQLYVSNNPSFTFSTSEDKWIQVNLRMKTKNLDCLGVLEIIM